MFAIVIFTVQFGIKTGLAVSIASSLLMFSIDLYFSPNRYSNQYFEADLVLAALFILSAFLLGRFVTIERDFSLTMGSYINIDTLTGCYNHRYFHEAIEKYIKGMGNEVNMLSVIILDINNFRSYNEKHGYTAGDLALEKIADIMKSLLRKGDIISRYAGEEFAVILPDTLEFEAILLGDKIRDTVNNTKFESADGDFINRLTVSIGVSSYPTSSKNKKMLINNIDESLYKAKYFNKQKIGLYTEIFKELRYELQKDSNQTIISIKTFISIINAKDGYTYGHTERVAFYCELFATKLGLSATDKKLLRYGAYLHDIGKMGIPKDILTKSEELTDDEWVIMKQHPKIGAEIIAPMDNFTNVLPLILYHHERYDGKGYPQQLKGENIPYLVKIVTLADSFDAMTSTRIYRHRRSFTDALEEIKRCTATQFDPELAPIFIEVAKDNVDTAERLRYVTPKDLAL